MVVLPVMRETIMVEVSLPVVAVVALVCLLVSRWLLFIMLSMQ